MTKRSIEKSHDIKLPLELQFIINNSRSFAVFFASLYGVLAPSMLIVAVNSVDGSVAWFYCVYFLVMSALYAVCAKKLVANDFSVSMGWLVFTAILALPTIFSIIGIFINVALWSNVAKASRFSKQGPNGYKLNSEWKKKNKKPQSLKKETINAAIFGGGLGLVVLILVLWSFVFSGTGNISSQDSLDKYAAQAVVDTKADMTFPYEVDEITLLNDIVASGNVIEYQYTIHDADTSTLSKTSLFELIKPSVCTEGSAAKGVLDEGVVFSYNYSIKETGEQYIVTISSDDCH